MDGLSKSISMIGRDNPTILDIGANHGHQTKEFLRRFPRGTVYSFEPEPRAIEMFLKVVDDSRANLVRKAVSDKNGMVNFYQSAGMPPDKMGVDWSEGWDCSGSIHKPKRHLELHPWCTFEKSIEVETVTLDDWARDNQIGRVDLLWADVQGAEGDLIRGGLHTLANTRLFYTEYSNEELYEGEVNLAAILVALPSFELVKDFGGDVLLINRQLS